MTVLKVYVVLVTFGPGSVSLCCVRGRFARDTVGRGTMAWNFSSGAPAMTDSVARSCRNRYLGLRQSQHLHFQKQSWRHSCHQLLLHPVTPPPTHHCCRRPPSHCLQWQKLGFMCAKRTEGGYLERLYANRLDEKRKKCFLSLQVKWSKNQVRRHWRRVGRGQLPYPIMPEISLYPNAN